MIRKLAHSIASGIARCAARLMPPEWRAWGQAMRHEVEAIDDAGPALLFALGCLGFASRRALASLPVHPMARSTRWMTALCAIASTLLGLAYLRLSGAPAMYLTINLGALSLGLIVVTLLALIARSWRPAAGSVCMALALSILLTALSGQMAEGAARWISIGRLSVQTSLFVLPLLVIIFAHRRDRLSTAAVAIAALSLAIQPDRAMAGALMAAMAALTFIRPERNATIALGAAMIGFMATLLHPDRLPAVPFVDGILASAFVIHPFVGLLVLGGVALLILPAIVGWKFDPNNRQIHVAFGALWLAIVMAAAIGNFPTPLVGYGGSAIIGYLLCLPGLPRRGLAIDAADHRVDATKSEEPQTTHRAAYGF